MSKKQAISDGKTYTVRLPQHLVSQVEELQEQFGTTPSEQIRRGLELWFAALERTRARTKRSRT